MSFLVLVGLLICTNATAETEKAEAFELPPLYSNYDEVTSRRYFTTLFENELPITAKPGRWSFRYNLKAGDILDETYLRFPLEARYGLTNKTEVFVSSTPYLPNPFESPSESSLGFAGLGFKHRLGNFIDDQWAFAFGAKAVASLEEIPTDDIRDQFLRFQPFVVTVYQPPSLPHWQLVNQLRYDYITDNPIHSFDVGATPMSTFFASPALIFTPNGEWRYSVQFDYQTDQFDGGADDAYQVSPGIGWFPRKNNFLKSVPGDFDFGLILTHKFSKLPVDSHRDDFDVKLRVRWIYYGKKNLSSTWKALTQNWRVED